MDAQTAESGNPAMPITFVEANAIDFVQDFQPHRFIAHSDDFAFFEEERWLQLRQIKAELAKSGDNLYRVGWGELYENIEVAGIADVTMVSDSVPADDEVSNAVCV